MNVSRVRVYDALYNQIANYIKANYQKYVGVPQFATFSKVYRPYEKNLSDQQPSFYLLPWDQAGDQDETGFGITRWDLTFYAIIYMNIDPKQENPTAGEVLLATIDMIDDALFNNGRPQTLASQNNNVPLVANAWINHQAGKIEIRMPILNPQGDIVIPITVLTGTQLPGQRTQ
jgi:hypothetical protein